jgi:MFS family permease
MKKHFFSLFSPEHRRRTMILFVISILLITVSQIVGITDNFPGISLLLSGMIFLFFTFLHPWRKVENYALLIGISVGIIVLVLLTIQVLVLIKKTDYISEGVVMAIVFLICLPGILSGIIGTLIYAFKKH